MDSTEVRINKNEKTVGMKKTSTLSVYIEGDQNLVDSVESVVKKTVSEKVEGGE